MEVMALADDVTASETPKKSKKKLIVLIVVPVVLLAGAAGFFLFGRGGGDATAVTTTTVAEVGEVIEGDTITVNLADSGKPRYARVTFAVVLPQGTDSGVVGMKIPLLKDRAVSIISTYTADTLLASGGLDDLRSRLSAAARDIWSDGSVMEVVLTEVLVQ